MQPFSPSQWQTLHALGRTIDQRLQQWGVGMTMGGEPTYIAAHDSHSLQWRYEALGEEKRQLAGALLARLQGRLAPAGSVRHMGLGKLYPGEPMPRWALGCFWREDGQPLWHNPAWLAADGVSLGHSWRQAAGFMAELRRCLGISPGTVLTAVEADRPEEPQGYVLPLLTVADPERPERVYWTSCHWQPWQGEKPLTLLPGTGPVGIRLPLGDLPEPAVWAVEAVPPLERPPVRPLGEAAPLAAPNSIRVALCVEVRQGTVHVYLPPIASARSFADVVMAVEVTAESLDMAVVLEGTPPPSRQGIQGFQITPDPGVIEVNIHPAASWSELVRIHQALDQEAIAVGLASHRYGWDGRGWGTGGGAHITIGGDRWQTSPLLRRPDLLRSFVTYWQHHPSLCYLFAGEYIGSTSQAPRPDEVRPDALYELEIAFLQLAPRVRVSPAIIDRLLRPLLVDSTGNPHRTALCIDKLFPVDNPNLQLGLLEFRGFEMPPHGDLRLLQMLLVRGLVALFWQRPYTAPLRRLGATLGDRFLLPHYLMGDWQEIMADLDRGGYPFEAEWFDPFWQWRFPIYGRVSLGNNPLRQLELRAALEPWPVLGDRSSAGTARPVDNSMERIQVRLIGAIGEPPQADRLAQRYQVLCNGVPIPLRSTGRVGEYVAGVRYRARPADPSNSPVFSPQVPLTFEVLDTWQRLHLGGAQYHLSSPTGKTYEDLPTSPTEAQARVAERFIPFEGGPWRDKRPPLAIHPDSPHTLDLRIWSTRLGIPKPALAPAPKGAI